MAFPPIDVLGVVSPALLTASRGIHGLAIYAGGGARGVRLLLSADPLARQVVDGSQGAVVPPLIEVPPHSRLGREVLGEVTPLAAGTQDVEDGIDYVAQAGLAWSAAGVDGQLRLDQKPLRVGYVAGVGLCSHESFYASSPPLMGQSLRPANRVHLWSRVKHCLERCIFGTTPPSCAGPKIHLYRLIGLS